MTRTVLVIGNGVTIDFMSFCNPSLFAAWHPSRPLSWDVRVEDGRPTRECLPEFFTQVDAALALDGGASDFAVIDRVVQVANDRSRAADALGWPASQTPGFAARRLDMEVRHFLGLAYSAFDTELRRHTVVDDWNWLSYIDGLGDELLAVMSFNYDTVIERALTGVQVPFFHCGVEQRQGIPLGKPHGSIDYAMSTMAVLAPPPDYPISNVFSLMDVPMVRLPLDELTRPRLHVEVVPPLGASHIRQFQWVWPIFDAFRQLSPAIDRCVLAGISGWPVDQPEIRDVLRVLRPATEVVVPNPDRRALITLDFHVRRLGLRPATWWPDGP